MCSSPTCWCPRAFGTGRAPTTSRCRRCQASNRSSTPFACSAGRLALPSNAAPDRAPVGLAQPALENLARILARQITPDLDDARHLVAGEVALKFGLEGRRRQAEALHGLHHRHQFLAELGIGNAEHRAILDAGDAQ